MWNIKLSNQCKSRWPVFNLMIDIHIMVNWQLSKQGICWPESHDHIAGSGTSLSRLSLDPIDLSPFGHLMKFTQRSFPLYCLVQIRLKHCLYWFGLSIVSKLVRFFSGGWGWCYIYLNYFISIEEILSGLVVSVEYWTIYVVGSNSTVFRIYIFFFEIEETCTFMNISNLKYNLSVI